MHRKTDVQPERPSATELVMPLAVSVVLYESRALSDLQTYGPVSPEREIAGDFSAPDATHIITNTTMVFAIRQLASIGYFGGNTVKNLLDLNSALQALAVLCFMSTPLWAQSGDPPGGPGATRPVKNLTFEERSGSQVQFGPDVSARIEALRAQAARTVNEIDDLRAQMARPERRGGLTGEPSRLPGAMGLVKLDDGRGDPLLCGVDSAGELNFCSSLAAGSGDDPLFYECTGSHCYCGGLWDCVDMWITACEGPLDSCIPGKCSYECDSSKAPGEY